MENHSDPLPEASVPRQSPLVSILIMVGVFIVTLTVVLVWQNSRAAASASPRSIAAQPPGQATQATVVPGKEVAPAELAGATEARGPVRLPDSYQLDVSFGDIGPQLVQAGAIDAERFVQLYADSGRPLTPAQKTILLDGSDTAIVIDLQNARFLLNFFWALGLANQNPILTEGPMDQYSEGDIGRFASTGGWTLGERPATELYATAPIISLTPAQQARLEEVAFHVYRPCCDNHTAFADCNHGMAMLGLLELLASQDASVDEMFAAAKGVNAFWFPQQALETAVFFKAAMNLDYADVDARMATGPEVFSGTGFRQVHQWLVENNRLAPPQGGGNSCGV